MRDEEARKHEADVLNLVYTHSESQIRQRDTLTPSHAITIRQKGNHHDAPQTPLACTETYVVHTSTIMDRCRSVQARRTMYSARAPHDTPQLSLKRPRFSLGFLTP